MLWLTIRAEDVVHLSADSRRYVARGDDSHPQRVLVMVMGQVIVPLHFCHRRGQPFTLGRRRRLMQTDDVIHAGGSSILQGQHGLPARFKKSRQLDQFAMHQRSMQHLPAGRIHHHGTPNENSQIAMSDGIQHSPALRKIATFTGGETHFQPGLQNPMHCRPRPRGHFASRRQQRSIQVDGNHLWLHNFTIARL